ncbi:MAG: hypothetical protein K6G00_12930 [Treponema sp.]|nr:hypothetical protein [Treponema sp.]
MNNNTSKTSFKLLMLFISCMLFSCAGAGSSSSSTDTTLSFSFQNPEGRFLG